MKQIIAIMLVISLSINAPLAEPDPDVGLPEIMIGMLVVGITIVAAVTIIKVYSTHEADQNKPVDIVLERSTDHHTWIPVVTNTVVLQGRTPISFYEEMLSVTNDTAFYRAMLLKK